MKRILILVQWSCDIPQEKLEKFLNFAQQELKPFYESNGCKRYELFFPKITKRKYFSYHIPQKKNRYTEKLLFNDLKEFEKFFEFVEKDQTAKEILGKYGQKFNVSSCSFKILRQMV